MPIDERRAAHRRRGLAVYPDDLSGDAERIAGIAALAERLAGPVRLRLPAFDLLLDVPPQVGPKILYLLAVDDYETADLELLTRHVGPGERLMVVGGGIGVAAALGAKLTAEPVVVVEANAALHPVIAAQVALNGGRAELVHAAAVADGRDHPAGTVAFEVSSEFWYSRIAEGEGTGTVPAIAFDALCEAHRPGAVLMDIEGAEEAILARAVPAVVSTLIVEIHTPDFGAARTGGLVSNLITSGFRLVDQQALTWAFKR
jgi:FkbM family methyltransferase